MGCPFESQKQINTMWGEIHGKPAAAVWLLLAKGVEFLSVLGVAPKLAVNPAGVEVQQSPSHAEPVNLCYYKPPLAQNQKSERNRMQFLPHHFLRLVLFATGTKLGPTQIEWTKSCTRQLGLSLTRFDPSLQVVLQVVQY